MYELRKGTMMMLTKSKSDADMYVKAGWELIKPSEDKSKNNKEKKVNEIKNENSSNSKTIGE